MEPLLTILAISAFVGMFAGFFFWKGPPLRGQALDRIEKVAKSLKGTVDAGTYFRAPRVRFEVHGYPAEMVWGRIRGVEDGSEPALFATVRLGGAVDESFKIWNRTRPWIPRLGLPWGLPRILTGEPALDSEFVVKARPASVVQRLFAPETRERTVPLVRGLAGDRVLTLSGGVLRAEFVGSSNGPGAVSALASQLREFTRLLLDVAGPR